MAEEKRDLRNAARREGKRMMRFGGVGVANTVADIAVFAGLVALGIAPLLANAAGFLIANLQSYVLNARVTFRDGGAPAQVSPAGYGKFLAAHLLSLVFSTAMLLLLANRIGPLPAKGAAMVFTFVWNYAASALFVFGAPQGEGRGA